ncbi:MAG TPA: peptidoglycan-binding protein [Candidatus Paceibacterota bacterium]
MPFSGMRIGASMKRFLSSAFVVIVVFSVIGQLLLTKVYADTILSTETFGSSSGGTVTGWDEGNPAEITGSGTNGSEDESKTSSSTDKFAKIGEDGWIRKTVTATGFQNLKLKYYWRGDADATPSDKGVVEYCSGSTCTSFPAGNILAQHDLDDNDSTHEPWSTQQTIDLPSDLNNSSFRIRFRNDANDNDEHFRIDDVSVEGDLIPTPTPTPSDTPTPTPSTTPTPTPSESPTPTPTPSESATPTPTPSETPTPTPAPSESPTPTPTPTCTPNLILNPCLEDEDTDSPEHWFMGNWGTNLVSFFFPVSGESGNGAQVDIAEYTDGDAKWYFEDVAVTPGQNYLFSDSYLSTTDSKVVARYTLGNGSYVYHDYGYLETSAVWEHFNFIFQAIDDAVSLSIFHLIQSVGSLTIDNASLTTTSETPMPLPTLPVSPTPTPTPSESPAPTPTSSDTPTPTPSESPTPTPTPSESATPTPTPNENSNNSGNGGGNIGNFINGPLANNNQVAGASTGGSNDNGGQVLGDSTCGEYLSEYIFFGRANNTNEVKKLQQFLNEQEGANLPITGFYGVLTRAAIKTFQLKYWQEILAPWVPFGLANDHTPTGNVGKTTKWKVNQIACPSLNAPFPQIP